MKKKKNNIFNKIKLSHLFDFTPEFIILLFILFLVLKLTQVVSWSWVGVLSPLWVPTLFFVIIYLMCYATRHTH